MLKAIFTVTYIVDLCACNSYCIVNRHEDESNEPDDGGKKNCVTIGTYFDLLTAKEKIDRDFNFNFGHSSAKKYEKKIVCNSYKKMCARMRNISYEMLTGNLLQ